jgi:hydrophobic/amphiphilic exporter-1 (mainly G- bacteria), HAE1 family
MGLTRVFLQRPTLVFVLLALIFLAGFISLRALPVQQFPNVIQPTITVNVSYSGAPTTVMRTDIVQPIENQLAGTPDLSRINSVVQAGTARISAIFTLTSDLSTDLAMVQKAVQAAQRQLPTNIVPPTISINDPAQSVVTTLAVTSTKMDVGKLSLVVVNSIAPAIQQIPGVSLVNAGGTVTPAYEVNADPFKLAAANLTLTDLYDTIANGNLRAPGGYVYGSNRQTSIDIRGDIQDPNSLLDLPIAPSSAPSTTSPVPATPGATDPWTTGSGVFRVRDVASVVDGYEPRLTYAQVNGTPGIFLQVQKTDTASEVTSSEAVIADLSQLQRQFPDVRFQVLNVQAVFTKQQIDGVQRTLFEGILLTGIVMLFFLAKWRHAVVVLIAIPTSLFVAITVMNILHMTLDTVSLLGMTLAIGILVDDSTVTLENIDRHFELGETPYNAALRGRSEIGMAAIVITLVDVVVFLPIAFLKSQVGEQLQEFGVVVAISTLASLFVSFTVTPTLAGRWALLSHWKPWHIIELFDRGFARVRTWYAEHVLRWALRRPWIVVAICAVSFVGAIALVPLGLVGETYIPPQDQGQIFIQAVYPSGWPIAKVRSGVFAMERVVDQNPDLRSEAAAAGFYNPPFGGSALQPNVGQIIMWLKDNRHHSTDWWVAQYRTIAAKVMPQADVTVVPATSTQGGNQQPIDEIVSDVTGGDPTAQAVRVYQLLAHTPGAVNVNSTASALAPQIAMQFDRAKMRALNVNITTAATAAEAAFGGAIATQFELPQGLEQVQLIYPMSNLNTVAQLAAVPVRASNGNIVHLGDFTHIDMEPTPPLIVRVNRNNVVHVNANVAPGYDLSNVQDAFQKGLPSLHLPSNITVAPAPFGQQDYMHQVLTGLGGSLILSIVLVFLLMVALYNSYSSPFIILFSVPVAAVGALGALLITHETLNLFSMIGTILLVGIATKNGILLVDYANTLRARGFNKIAAIRESARTRFRPIVMTSVSIVAANIPLALALEPGSSVRSSLGVVVCGGALSSLALTLVLVPVMYMWLAPKRVPQIEGIGTNGSTKTPEAAVAPVAVIRDAT